MKDRLARSWQATGALLRRSGVWTGLKIVLAVALVGYVASQIRPAELILLWRSLSPPWLAASVLAYLAITVAMARRYWHLIDRQISFRQTFGLVVVQTVLGNFVASGAGLASYVAILRGRHQVRVSQALWSVLLSRLGDLVALLAALVIAAWAVWPQIAPLHLLVVILIAVLGTATFALGLIFLLRQQALGFLSTMLVWTRLDRLSISRRVLAQIQVAVAQPDLAARTAQMLGYSALIAALQFAFSFSYAQMLAVPISGWDVLFVLTFSLLISLVPIQVFGGLGVYEVTAIYLYGLIGLSQDLVVPLVVSSRIYLYLLNLLLLVYLPFESHTASPEAAQATEER